MSIGKCVCVREREREREQKQIDRESVESLYWLNEVDSRVADVGLVTYIRRWIANLQYLWDERIGTI